MLKLRDLSKRYGPIRALDGCSFDVMAGQMLGFLGPNGAGKTTTMRCVFGLVDPDEGDVTWDGHPIGPADLLRFGYMPEQRGLYPKMRIADQVAYFGRLHGQAPDEARSSAERWLDRLGLGERLTDRLEQLSHGNQQRVQLAAALVHDPELLVLDEPFSGLDPLAVETMAEVLRERASAGAAVVFSSHQLDLVEDICEYVAIINDGRVVLTGALGQLKRSAPVRRMDVVAPGATDGWYDRVPGAREVRHTGETITVLLDAGIDADTALRAIGGPVESFSFSPPSLSDLFREAVR